MKSRLVGGCGGFRDLPCQTAGIFGSQRSFAATPALVLLEAGCARRSKWQVKGAW